MRGQDRATRGALWPDPRESTDMNVQKFRRRRIARMSAWFAIAALVWQVIRTAARTRRLEHATHTWRVAGSPVTNTDQHHCIASPEPKGSFSFGSSPAGRAAHTNSSARTENRAFQDLHRR
jgi:hypothetical protein